jgi:hypothetical protein
MKVFLSWSGTTSHRVACSLRDWIPCVIQAVKPYVSSEDIDKGARWSTDIAQELEEAAFGILCITKDNLEAPWLNFEAGALSKTIDKSYVSPFLFHIKRSEVQGPLLQFQSTIYDRDDVFKLLVSMNSKLEMQERLDEPQLQKSFSVWWPQLQGELDNIDESKKPSDKDENKENTSHQSEILEELLELVRNQQRLLRSPEDLLPPTYLSSIVRRVSPELSRLEADSIDLLHEWIIDLDRLVNALSGEDSLHRDIQKLVARIHDKIHSFSPTRIRSFKTRSLPRKEEDAVKLTE